MRTETMKTLSAKEYFHDDSELITKASKETGISRSIIANHVKYGVPISVATATRLQTWDKKISAAKTLGLE